MARLKESELDEYEAFYNEVIAPQEEKMDIPSYEGDSNTEQIKF